MNHFSVFFDENQITANLRHKPGSVGGNIQIQINNKFFPSDGCYDRPVTILIWWLENCLKLESNAESLVENYFMDGPYEFWAIKKLDNVELKFFRRNASDDGTDDIYIEILPSKEIPFSDYKRTLCLTGNKMLEILEKNLLSDETEKLKSLINILEAKN
jgi:hypothetical protein